MPLDDGGVAEPQTLALLAEAVDAFVQQRDWAQFHTPKNLATALSVEASELLEIFQWLTPEQSAALTSKQRRAAADEIADVLIYLLQLSRRLDIDPLVAGFSKLRKNADKYPVEKSRGTATKYTEL